MPLKTNNDIMAAALLSKAMGEFLMGRARRGLELHARARRLSDKVKPLPVCPSCSNADGNGCRECENTGVDLS